MRSVLFACVCLFGGSLAAEVIGHVEYQLPSKEWQIANQLESKKTHSTTVIYIPENATREKTPEFFGAHVNDRPTDLTDTNSLAKALEQGFPNSHVTLTVLTRTPESILYEWSLSSAGHEKVHGWTRAFSSPQETVMLNFQTEELNKIEELRPTWVRLLETAKILH